MHLRHDLEGVRALSQGKVSNTFWNVHKVFLDSTGESPKTQSNEMFSRITS